MTPHLHPYTDRELVEMEGLELNYTLEYLKILQLYKHILTHEPPPPPSCLERYDPIQPTK